MAFQNPFTAHPRAVGETYAQHLWMAGRFSIQMIMGGVACLIHALLPFLFVRTGSNCATRLYVGMTARRIDP